MVLAGFGRRAVAFAVDAPLTFVALNLLVGAFVSAEDAYWVAFAFGYYAWITFPALFVGLLPPVFAGVQALTGGRTPGRALVGIAVRDPDGARLPFGRLLKREAFRGLMLAPLFVLALFDWLAGVRHPYRQTWHDRVADTHVIRAPLRR
jgi:uncharacterized RDD family membrane protein YckC